MVKVPEERTVKMANGNGGGSNVGCIITGVVLCMLLALFFTSCTSGCSGHKSSSTVSVGGHTVVYNGHWLGI